MLRTGNLGLYLFCLAGMSCIICLLFLSPPPHPLFSPIHTLIHWASIIVEDSAVYMSVSNFTILWNVASKTVHFLRYSVTCMWLKYTVFTRMMCCLLSVLVYVLRFLECTHWPSILTHRHIYIYIYIYTTTFTDNVFVIKIIILTWWCVLWSGLLLQDEVWMNERMNIYGTQKLPHTKPCVHFVQGFSNASTDCTHRSRTFTVAGTKEAQHVLVKKCEQMLTLRHSPWWETTPKLAGKRTNFKIVHQYLWPKTPLQNKQNGNSFRLGNLSHIFLKN